jgi:hypothetical protein
MNDQTVYLPFCPNNLPGISCARPIGRAEFGNQLLGPVIKGQSEGKVGKCLVFGHRTRVQEDRRKDTWFLCSAAAVFPVGWTESHVKTVGGRHDMLMTVAGLGHFVLGIVGEESDHLLRIDGLAKQPLGVQAKYREPCYSSSSTSATGSGRLPFHLCSVECGYVTSIYRDCHPRFWHRLTTTGTQ